MKDRGKQLVPKQIIIEVTSRCNLICKECPYVFAADAFNDQDMSFDFFRSIINRIDFPTVVIPWMNGESLMHPQIYDIWKYILDRELTSYLTTNGHFWNDRLFQLLTDDTSCYQVIFSLDGLPIRKSRSIEKARPGSNRLEVVGNIDRFLALKRAKDAKIDVAVKIVHRGQDWEEIENYIHYWLERGVDYVCEGGVLNEDTVDEMRIYPCQYFDNNFMVIRADGRVVLCAYNNAIVNRGKNPIGILDRTTPLLDFYNNSQYMYYRKRQCPGVFDGPCATCGFAYTGMGFDGEVRFRNPEFGGKKIFYRRDYYNSFYSYRDKRKPALYYK